MTDIDGSPRPVPLVYTLDEVALLLKMSRCAVKGMVDRGQLPAIKAAPARRGAVRIPKVAVDRLLGAETEGAA